MNHAWRNAALGTALISSAPVLILPCLPHSATKAGSPVQRVMLCFAVGGMIGDVFLHLLPHLFMSGGHGNDHVEHTPTHHNCHEGHDHEEHTSGLRGHVHEVSDLVLPMTVLAGFMFFFVCERGVRAILDGDGSGRHSHSHDHDNTPSGKQLMTAEDVSRRKKDDDYVASSSNEACPITRNYGKSDRPVLKVAGILNLAADSLHNLTDGIAIGAAFAAGPGLGYTTTLATLMHELPHEMGDFAVLVQSGLSKWQAIGAQFATATAAFAGTGIGLLVTSYAEAKNMTLAATAGGFLYVSCVAVMPDILNSSPSFFEATSEIAAMCCGVALMAGVALLE